MQAGPLFRLCGRTHLPGVISACTWPTEERFWSDSNEARGHVMRHCAGWLPVQNSPHSTSRTRELGLKGFFRIFDDHLGLPVGLRLVQTKIGVTGQFPCSGGTIQRRGVTSDTSGKTKAHQLLHG